MPYPRGPVRGLSAEISEHTLGEIYLPPSHVAVQRGAASPIHYNALGTARPAGECDLTRPRYSVESKCESRWWVRRTVRSFAWVTGAPIPVSRAGT